MQSATTIDSEIQVQFQATPYDQSLNKGENWNVTRNQILKASAKSKFNEINVEQFLQVTVS